MQTGNYSKKGLEKVLAIITVKPKDRHMSFWIKRCMWTISLFSMIPALMYGDTSSILMLLLATVAWGIDAAGTKRRIYFYLDLVCLTIVSSAMLTIMLSGSLGLMGAFMVLSTAVITLFLLGVFWGGIFGLFHCMFVTFIMNTPSLDWIRESYSEPFCERFPQIFICFVVIASIIEYGIQEFWMKKYDYRTELNRLIENGKKEHSDVSIKVLLTMHKAMSTKVPKMQQHSESVGEWTRSIAGTMGYRRDELQTMYYAGLLHDVGKIGIPDAILNNDKEWTDDEYRVYMQHVDIGYEILRNLQQSEIADAARYHHEKMDGSGYKVARGTSIPMVARIVGVANYVVRQEDKGVSDAQIIEGLLVMREEKYDQDVVDAAIKLLEDRIRREKEALIFS